MKRFLLFLLIILAACASPDQGPSQTECVIDSDCTCGGIIKETGECFVGNKQWALDHVDMKQSCPDFCTGIAGHLETKCVSNECKTVPRGSVPQNTQCQTDEDCVVTGCSSHLCMPRAQVEKEPFFTTCEWKEEYACKELSTCGCFFGTCRWDQTTPYVDCLQKAQAQVADTP